MASSSIANLLYKLTHIVFNANRSSKRIKKPSSEKEIRQVHIKRQIAKAEKMTSEAQNKIIELKNILSNGLFTNNTINTFKANYKQDDIGSIIAYNTMVLEQSIYPMDFPKTFRIAYIPEAKELVIDYELPQPSVIPTVIKYTYVKTKDTIKELYTDNYEATNIYYRLLEAVSIRVCHEIFKADICCHIDNIVFNGFVMATYESTGKDSHAYLISIRVQKDLFLSIDLKNENDTLYIEIKKMLSLNPCRGVCKELKVDLSKLEKRYFGV